MGAQSCAVTVFLSSCILGGGELGNAAARGGKGTFVSALERSPHLEKAKVVWKEPGLRLRSEELTEAG